MPTSSPALHPVSPLPLDCQPPRRLLAAAATFCLIPLTLPLWQPLPVPAALGLPLLAVAGLFQLRALAGRRGTFLLLPCGECQAPDAVRWQIGPGTRVFAGLVVLHLSRGLRRQRWWFTRDSLPPETFRELKCRLRLGSAIEQG